MSLIVIHGYDNIIPAAAGLRKYCVRRNGAVCADTLCLSCFNCRNNFVNFLSSEQAVLTAVRI